MSVYSSARKITEEIFFLRSARSEIVSSRWRTFNSERRNNCVTVPRSLNTEAAVEVLRNVRVLEIYRD